MNKQAIANLQSALQGLGNSVRPLERSTVQGELLTPDTPITSVTDGRQLLRQWIRGHVMGVSNIKINVESDRVYVYFFTAIQKTAALLKIGKSTGCPVRDISSTSLCVDDASKYKQNLLENEPFEMFAERVVSYAKRYFTVKTVHSHPDLKSLSLEVKKHVAVNEFEGDEADRALNAIKAEFPNTSRVWQDSDFQVLRVSMMKPAAVSAGEAIAQAAKQGKAREIKPIEIKDFDTAAKAFLYETKNLDCTISTKINLDDNEAIAYVSSVTGSGVAETANELSRYLGARLPRHVIEVNNQYRYSANVTVKPKKLTVETPNTTDADAVFEQPAKVNQMQAALANMVPVSRVENQLVSGMNHQQVAQHIQSLKGKIDQNTLAALMKVVDDAKLRRWCKPGTDQEVVIKANSIFGISANSKSLLDDASTQHKITKGPIRFDEVRVSIEGKIVHGNCSVMIFRETPHLMTVVAFDSYEGNTIEIFEVVLK